ncbi:hypothetical protein SCE1572_48420 [Sorangium cellulosum So0157-2]|uniref:Uncharacterized protein n=1 Tax=Sorangium cellulosum So0157-2 TaxID=1254432 RepID=S4YBD5_SORCE|nr:hypothetical protein SCE1572_48420 [Sorangium cellulosum So0157-2]
MSRAARPSLFARRAFGDEDPATLAEPGESIDDTEAADLE